MTGKSLLYTAAVSLAVCVTYEKLGKPGAKPGAARIGN